MEQESFTTYIIDKIRKFYNIFNKFKHEYTTLIIKFIYKLFSYIFRSKIEGKVFIK